MRKRVRNSWDGNYWRLLEAAEAYAALHGSTRLPSRYSDALAEITGYTPNSVKALMTFIRNGRIGPEAAARALRLRTTPRMTIHYELVIELMDKGLASSVVHERVNAYRQARGLEPTSINVIRSTMSQIRKKRRLAAQAQAQQEMAA